MSESLIRLRKINWSLSSSRCLQVSEFDISPGQHWCVFGGNGAGKSKLAELVCGNVMLGREHLQYAEGFSAANDVMVVSFEEQQRLWEHDNRHDISEYNDTAIDQGTTVASLILGSAEVDENYNELLDTLNIRALEMRGIRYLSSGQLRKALIARALFRRPRLLILDDPLESVDRDSQQLIRTVLSAWMGAESTTTSTLLLCRRERDILPGITHMAIMEKLTLVAQGTIDEIRDREVFMRVSRRPKRILRSLPAAISESSLLPVMSHEPMIELIEVNAGYNGQPVLKNISWIMRSGQHSLIEGPNGCGKSTLLSLINGDNHKAYGQEVYLFGKKRGSGETVWDVKARFGVVSNELHSKYVKGWRVIDVVVSGFFASIGLYDDCGSRERNAALAWLGVFDIHGLASHYYHELSFGEQRLVLLARAMVKAPSILILDEPCVGLDDYYRRLILDAVELIAATTGTHIIYVTHTAGEAPACMNQRITFTSSGRVNITP
jgi:molybdate transport system ATP-binding protein